MTKEDIRNGFNIENIFNQLNELDKDLIAKFVVNGNRKGGQYQKYYSPGEKPVYNGRTISTHFHPSEFTIKKWFGKEREFIPRCLEKLCKLKIFYLHPVGRAGITYNMNPEIAYPILKKIQEEYEKSIN